MKPCDAQAYGYRAGTRFFMQDTARALEDYAMDDLAGAIADYDAALDLQPAYRSAYFNRGNARLRLHDLRGALADHEMAARLDPARPEPFYTMGVARMERGMQGEACRDFRKAYGMGYAPAQEMIRVHRLGDPRWGAAGRPAPRAGALE